MLDFLSQVAPWLILGLIVGMLLSIELGFLYGVRESRRHPEMLGSGSGAIEAAIFALLGLLLAFTFSAAQARMDTRRQLLIQETNDIGTAYLRLDLLPIGAQPGMRQQFRDYVDARIAVYEAIPDLEKVKQELEQSERIQKKIWAEAVAALQGGDSSAAILLLPALNAMIDITTARTTMARTHTPWTIFGLLLLLALLSAAVAGYGMSKTPTRNWFHRIFFVLVVSMTVYVIFDLEFPRRGLIRLDAADHILIELRQSMDGA